MSKKKLFVIDTFVVLFLLAFDQFTKYLSVHKLMNKPAFVLINGILEFDYLENRGVAFGMMQNQKWFILLTTFILLAVVLFILFRLPEGRKFTILHFVLSAIIAGGIGNMIDRLRLGYVIDFISFVLIDFPTFNVADCYIVCATIVMFIMFVFVLKEEDMDFLSFRKKKE